MSASIINLLSHLGASAEVITEVSAAATSHGPDGSATVVAVGAALIALFSAAALVVVRARRA